MRGSIGSSDKVWPNYMDIASARMISCAPKKSASERCRERWTAVSNCRQHAEENGNLKVRRNRPCVSWHCRLSSVYIPKETAYVSLRYTLMVDKTFKWNEVIFLFLSKIIVLLVSHL